MSRTRLMGSDPNSSTDDNRSKSSMACAQGRCGCVCLSVLARRRRQQRLKEGQSFFSLLPLDRHKSDLGNTHAHTHTHVLGHPPAHTNTFTQTSANAGVVTHMSMVLSTPMDAFLRPQASGTSWQLQNVCVRACVVCVCALSGEGGGGGGVFFWGGILFG